MQIKKTVGKVRLSSIRKDYVIHTTCGKRFYAKAVGTSGYECGDVSWRSLKELKTHISNGGFNEDATEPTETSTADGADTWGCVHPCALLIYNTREYDPRNNLVLGDMEYHTLDAYGWLDVMGRPDIARAEREIKRVQNLNKGN